MICIHQIGVRLFIAITAYLILLFSCIHLLGITAPVSQSAIGLFIPAIVLMAFIFQSLDSTMGMGFGTAIAPLLIAMGYDPLSVVPMLLLVQSFSGILAGWLHHDIGNVHFTFKPMNIDTRATVLVAIIGVFAALISIYTVYAAINLPDKIIESYIGLTVIVMGLIVILKHRSRWRQAYNERRLLMFALIAGINKGIGAGGFGPVVILGAIYSGIKEKSAVAFMTMAEGIVSLVGAAAFMILMVQGKLINYELLPSVLTGSFFAAQISPYLVKIIPSHIYRFVVPVYAIAIGGFILTKHYLI